MRSLQNAVNKFKNKNHTQEVDMLTVLISQIKDPKRAEDIQKIYNNYISGNTLNNVHEIYQTDNQETPTSLINQLNLKVTIQQNEVRKDGILSQSYVAYKLVTEPNGWEVWRRFSDFSWLRQALCTEYP